ncbi:Uma2 family endonuclease [Pendulispora brunnea]|uniref:Uma2 family endonuclease n=1 Tax=Pendulispora brunnea TaxID=2905690 RepID=A0ABZ2KCX0_9BACT
MASAPVLHNPVRRLRRAEYETLAETGAFENERVELLYGTIVHMSPKGIAHDRAIERLNELLLLQLAGRVAVRIQSAFAASDGSEPEPDIAIVPRDEHRTAHPDKAFLLIEVADSSLLTDRTTKAQLYAECGVPEYWVVNVRDGIVEVHTEIVAGAYTRLQPYRPGGILRPTAFPDAEIRVSDIL